MLDTCQLKQDEYAAVDAIYRWFFSLNEVFKWDDLSPETKTRLRSLPTQAVGSCLAFGMRMLVLLSVHDAPQVFPEPQSWHFIRCTCGACVQSCIPVSVHSTSNSKQACGCPCNKLFSISWLSSQTDLSGDCAGESLHPEVSQTFAFRVASEDAEVQEGR